MTRQSDEDYDVGKLPEMRARFSEGAIDHDSDHLRYSMMAKPPQVKSPSFGWFWIMLWRIFTAD